MEAVDYTPYAYEIDSPAEYQWYKIDITCDAGGFQLNEIMIMGPHAATVDVDTTDMILAEVDAESIAVEGINPWGDGENETKLFDGNKGNDDDHGTKLGGDVTDNTFTVTFNTKDSVVPYYYAITTGNDSGDYTGRNPNGWTLYGSNDGENWDELDKVVTDDTHCTGMSDVNYTSFVYKIDAAKKEYKNFKIVFTTAGGNCQLNEFELFTLQSLNTADDVSALSVAAVNADSITAEGIEAWPDGPATNLFDGNKGVDDENSGTKLGGGVGEDKKVVISFQTESPVTVKYYAITTGNDSGIWTGRNPIRWALSGSTDGEKYTVISNIKPEANQTAGLLDANYTTYNYAVDENNQAEYQFYKITLYTEGETLQLNELELLY